MFTQQDSEVLAKIDDFIASYHRKYSYYRIGVSAFSSTVFAHILNADVDEFKELDWAWPRFGGDFNQIINAGICARDYIPTFDDEQLRRGGTLLKLIAAANLDVAEVIIMLRLVREGFKSKYEELFEASVYPQLIEATIDWDWRKVEAYSGVHRLPFGIPELMLALAEVPEGGAIYNPSAGLADIGILAPPDISYYGQELDDRIWAVGKIRLAAYLKSTSDREYVNEDFSMTWKAPMGKYDLIVADLPFNWTAQYVDNEPEGKAQGMDVESLFLNRALNAVNANGKVIALLSNQFLYMDHPRYNRMKFQVIDMGYLETVISFPERLLIGTSAPFAILVMNTAKPDNLNGRVRFVMADKFIQTIGKTRNIDYVRLLEAIHTGTDAGVMRVVPYKQIKQNNYNLIPRRYFFNSNDIPGHALKGFIKPVESSYTINDPTLPIISSADLGSGLIDFRLDLTTKYASTLDKTPKIVSVLHGAGLLIDMRGGQLRPTYYDGNQGPVQLPPSITAYQHDHQLIDIEYLVFQLMSDSVKYQVNALSYGTSLSQISIHDFISIRIPMPTLAEQLDIVQRSKENLFKQREHELDELRTRLNLEVEHNIANSYLRHSIAGPLGNLHHNLQKLTHLLKSISDQRQPLDLNEKHKGYKDRTIRNVLDLLNHRVIQIRNEVRRTGKKGLKGIDYPLSIFDLHAFLHQFTKDEDSNTHELQFTVDQNVFPKDKGEAIFPLIEGNEALFNKLMNNLIENADRHAFYDKRDSSNIIHIWLSQVNEPYPSLLLRVANTGRPFPDGFTKEKFVTRSMQAGELERCMQGDGMGGAVINDIVRHFRGSFDLDTEPDEQPFSTIFSFYFPITTQQ